MDNASRLWSVDNSALLTQTPKQKPGITKQCSEQIRHKAEWTARGSSTSSEWTPESSLGLEERCQMTEKCLIASHSWRWTGLRGQGPREISFRYYHCLAKTRDLYKMEWPWLTIICYPVFCQFSLIEIFHTRGRERLVSYISGRTETQMIFEGLAPATENRVVNNSGNPS